MTTPTVAQLYGGDAAKAVAAANIVRAAAEKVDPIGDPTGTIGYAVDAGRDLAALLGVEADASSWTGAAGIIGTVIERYVNRLVDRVDRKGKEELKKREVAQEAVLLRMSANAAKAGRGWWELTATDDQLQGAAAFTNYRSLPIPGFLEEASEDVFPRDAATGCYRVEPPAKGKALVSDAPFRMWPVMWPVCFNTTDLRLRAATRSALLPSARALFATFDMLDAGSNLVQDARLVLSSWRQFWAWSTPMRRGLKGGGLVMTAKGWARGDLTPASFSKVRTDPDPTTRIRYNAGERNVYFNDDGVTLVAHKAETIVDDEGDPLEYARTWYRFDRGRAEPIGTCSIDAYNHVVMAFARFFALRDRLMRTRRAWPVDVLDAARASKDPAMQAELKRPPPPVPAARPTTTTRPANVPVPVKRLDPKPVRVGRADPVRVGRHGELGDLAMVLAAPDMREMLRRMAAVGRR